jgi:hypothetical protein
MASGKQTGHTGTAKGHPAVTAATGLLHHRRGWTWTLVASAAGFIVVLAVTLIVAVRGTASVILSVIEVLMLLVFLISLAMVIVYTSRLRQHAPSVREPAGTAHRAARGSLLSHPHNLRRHPVEFAVVRLVLLGWVVGGVVLFPRLIDSAAYVAGAGGHATFMPTTYVEQCAARTGCETITNGNLELGGHVTAATWPAQVPLDSPFSVREPVWRWALGSGLINGIGSAIGTFVVCLLFDASAILALYIAVRPALPWVRRGRHKPPPARRHPSATRS